MSSPPWSLTHPARGGWPWRLWPALWRLLRPLCWRVPLLLLVTLAVFLVLRALPVDPLGMLLPATATPEDVAMLSRALGLDQPLLVQYSLWLWHALQGDWGQSIQRNLPVAGLLLQALPMTLELLVLGMGWGLLIGVGSGMLAFSLRGRWLERAIQLLNGLTMSIPDFLWGILLILGVGIGLQWLPFVGPMGPGIQIERITGFLLLDSVLQGQWAATWSVLQHLALPSLALGLGIATPVARILHASLHESYNDEYIHAAQLRGIGGSQLLLRHALPNAALPTISLIGVQASTVIGGTLLIESIYGLPGIGSLMLSAITSHDLPVIQALTVTYAVAVQGANLLSDWLLQALNPRLREEAR